MQRLNLGFFKQKTIWWPTLRGWLVLLLILMVLLIPLSLGLKGLYPFLAISRPVPANILLVEGWVSDNTIKEAITEFKRNSYEYLITTGIPIPRGDHLSEYHTYAELAAATCRALGFPTNHLIAAPGEFTYRDRTRQSAIAAKKSILEKGIVVKGLNVVTRDTHGRRSLLVYQRVLSAQTPVGVIAYPAEDYDPDRWWASSAGIKSVIPEALGWAYELVFGSR
jgi:hypothetical protein